MVKSRYMFLVRRHRTEEKIRRFDCSWQSGTRLTATSTGFFSRGI